MTPKFFKTSIGDFVPAEWSGENTSGWSPLGDKIMVLPDTVAEVIRGIHIPDDLRDRQTMAAEAGVVIAVGDGAFQYDINGQLFMGRKPTPGDRVAISRYAGQIMWGHDGQRYRVLSTSEIGAIEVAKEKNNVN